MVGLGMFGLYECSLPTPPSRQAQVDSWNSAHAAMDNFQYEKAADIAHRLINKNPNYYYGYTFLGYLALERTQLEEAEKNFARAYELFPTPDHRDKLEAVRKRLAAESRD
jgi:tetratricopeptide (TPR) repeat protein